MIAMYVRSKTREYEEFKLQAALHGAKIDDDADEIPRASPPPPSVRQSSSQSPMLFRDPRDYEGMSEEEKQELTDKMMGMHRAWAQTAPLGGR